MPHFDHFPRPGEFDPYRPCRLIWCPVGGVVGGCGARAVSRKTHIYFIDKADKPKKQAKTNQKQLKLTKGGKSQQLLGH